MMLDLTIIARASRNFAADETDPYPRFQEAMLRIGRKEHWLGPGKEVSGKLADLLEQLLSDDPAHQELQREVESLARL